MQGAALPPAGGRCFAGGGGQAPALQGAALPPAVQGFRPSHVRWSVFSPAAGDEPPAIQGAAVIVSLAVGDECRRCRVPALPRPVVGVSLAAGDKPQPYIRSAALPPAAGDERRRCRGWRCRRPVGDECRRCRVPALPRPVVGVSPAAGDKPQPYRGRRCRRRRGTSAGVAGGGVAAGGTLGRRLLYGRTVELLHVAE